MNKNNKNNAISNFYLIGSIKFNYLQFINSMEIKFNALDSKQIFNNIYVDNI